MPDRRLYSFLRSTVLVAATPWAASATPDPVASAWRDLAGMRFSAAQPQFSEAVERSHDAAAGGATVMRARLGLALSLWAAQPTRGPDYDRALTILQDLAEQADPADAELAAAARFLWGRASWLGGDESTAAGVFEDMAESMDTPWHERAAVARIQMAVTTMESDDALHAAARNWLATIRDPMARQGMHLALAEMHLVYGRASEEGAAHFEAALVEGKMGFRLRADTLLSAGRLLANAAPQRAAGYLRQFMVENPLDGRRQLAAEVLAELTPSNGEGGGQ